MKQFNLEKALAGEPVKLCDGRKAYIQGTVPKGHYSDYGLVGYVINTDGKALATCWTLEGRDDIRWKTSKDIVGMWEEPKRYVNGIEVPESVTEETWENGGHYWYPTLDHNDNVINCRFYADVPIHKKLIRQGLVFKTEEDARIMAKALLNYTVEQINE